MTGVTSTGYVPKTQQQIANDDVAQAQGLIEAGLDLSPVAPMGQVVAISAEKDAELWELGAPAYNATSRRDAEGAQLDNVGALMGCKRLPATYSQVWCSCTFTAAGTYAKGALVGFISGLSSQSASNLAAVVVPTNHPDNGLPVSNTNPYTTGTSYAPATLFQAPLTGPNFGNALVAANAGQPGNVGAFAGMIPVSGWTALVDLSTPKIGAAIESDTAYRIRQAQQLGAQGSCNLDAIRVDVIDALEAAPSPVAASCTVYENTSDFTVYENTSDFTDGLPPHSYQVVVFDGTNPNTVQDDPIIAQAIWDNKPPGIAPHGNVTTTVLDSQGVTRSVSFQRPTPINVYMVVNVAIAAKASETEVRQIVSTAIIDASQGQPFLAYGVEVAPSSAAPTTLLPGIDVVPGAFAGIAQAQAGVVQVTSVLVGTTPNPTSGSVLPISRSSVAVLAGVQVNVTTFVP